MTPFGERLREMRRARGFSQKQMARALGVSAAYVSALEHGRRGVPTWAMVQKIIGYFNVIWDEAEELERLAASSDPRVVVDTAGLSPRATELANRIAEAMPYLTDDDIEAVRSTLEARLSKAEPVRTGFAARRAYR